MAIERSFHVISIFQISIPKFTTEGYRGEERGEIGTGEGGWERGRGGAIHICRSEIRTPLPSIPRLEVIITYIRQLTRVHPLPLQGKLQAVPDTISRCADRAVMVRTPLLFYIVSALRLLLRAMPPERKKSEFTRIKYEP